MRIWSSYSRAGALTALFALVLGQADKYWMIAKLTAEPNQRLSLTPFFDLVLSWNNGISYGLLKQESDLGRLGLIGFALLMVVGLIYLLARIETLLAALSIGLIIGGALGNTLDRIHYGAVADFFSFHIGSHRWYIFNVADIAIVAGVAGLLYDSLRTSHKKVENKT